MSEKHFCWLSAEQSEFLYASKDFINGTIFPMNYQPFVKISLERVIQACKFQRTSPCAVFKTIISLPKYGQHSTGWSKFSYVYLSIGASMSWLIVLLVANNGRGYLKRIHHYPNLCMGHRHSTQLQLRLIPRRPTKRFV